MSANLAPLTVQQFFDNNGRPLANGLLYTYQSGTTTPQATYTDWGGLTPNTNPVVLNARGEASIWITPGQSYKFLLQDKDGNTIPGWPVDNVSSDSGLSASLALSSGASIIGASDGSAGSLWTTAQGFINKIISSAGASVVGYISSVTGSIATTIKNKFGEKYSAFDFLTAAQIADVQVVGFTLDLSTALNTAITNLPAYATLEFPAGGYSAHLSVRRSNITLKFNGPSTIVKMPATVDSIVLELGNTALGNGATAYENVNVLGFPTLDGNYLNVPTPANDLTGHAFATTKISHSVWQVVGQNCQNTCFGTFIDSNFNRADVRALNGGNALIGGTHYPNFDVNSSKYSTYKVVSEGGFYGGRILDNCFGIQLDLVSYNASISHLVYNNQAVNQSYGNRIHVTGIGGCASGPGVNVGSNCHGGELSAELYGVTGVALTDTGGANPTSGMTINLDSYNAGQQGALLYGTQNVYNINSYLDGRTGAAGSSFAVDVNGAYNTINAKITDSAVAQVRGLVNRAGATNNQINLSTNTTVQNFLQQDTSNTTTGYPVLNSLSTSSLVGTKTAATLNAGWSAVAGNSGSVPSFALDPTGTVRLYGQMSGGTGAAFNMPAGYRPKLQTLIPTTSNGAATCTLYVTTGGDLLVLNGSALTVVLDGLSFPTMV